NFRRKPLKPFQRSLRLCTGFLMPVKLFEDFFADHNQRSGESQLLRTPCGIHQRSPRVYDSFRPMQGCQQET
ncbi:hypothetical protein, partial [Variovorax sp. Root411]|uniref:hypothetical protein n=1 Tax=Variovorax sp. Root411 TaxID=1736530 RepID=UPI001F40C12B